MKVVVVSANYGAFEKHSIDHAPQSVACDFVHFNEVIYPMRFNSFTPRMMARMIKTHMCQLVPDYDLYIWIDASCKLSDPDAVKWFIQQIEEKEIAVFRHPHRKTIVEEAQYLRERLSRHCPYITPRYEHEDTQGQLDAIAEDWSFNDTNLYASTAFICRNVVSVHRAMMEWWYHITRYHSIDQLSLPYILFKNRISVNVIEENYLKIPYLTYVRNK